MERNIKKQKRMRGYILLLFVISLVSCGTPKFYNEVKSMNQNYKALVNKYGRDVVEKSSFDPHKLVFKKLNSRIQNSSHIVYHYSPSSNWRSKEFSGVVFDVENNKYYYIANSEKQPRVIQVDPVYDYPHDNYYKFIIDSYRAGKKAYLKKLGNISGHSGIRNSETIYDINLNTNKSQKFVFKDFLFMNGKPTRDVEQ